MIRLYFKISENLVRLIFQGGFWVVHIPFVRMVKFKLLAQFPVDHLANPVMSSLILSVRQFTAFAYVIDRFASLYFTPYEFITTASTGGLSFESE